MIKEKQQIEFIKTFLIPFYNSKDDNERVNIFNSMFKNMSLLADFDEETRKYLAIELSESISIKDNHKKQVKEVFELIYEMLNIAFSENYIKKPNKLINELDDCKFSKLEKRIKELIEFDNVNKSYFWRGIGLCCDFTEKAEIDTLPIYDIAECYIVRLLFELFKSDVEEIKEFDLNKKEDLEKFNSYEKNLEENQILIRNECFILVITKGIGFKFFNICPKCGKFFYKKRKDQVFCSEKCREAEHQKRYRIKNKK